VKAMTTAMPALLLVAGLLSGCEPDKVAGGDRDRFGCLPSAGYQWCPATGACERPWELAEARGFDNTQAGFEAFCTESATDQ